MLITISQSVIKIIASQSISQMCYYFIIKSLLLLLCVCVIQANAGDDANGCESAKKGVNKTLANGGGKEGVGGNNNNYLRIEDFGDSITERLNSVFSEAVEKANPFLMLKFERTPVLRLIRIYKCPFSSKRRTIPNLAITNLTFACKYRANWQVNTT